MFVFILQRLGLLGSRHSAEPLQSRADQNTWNDQSGGPQKKSKPATAGTNKAVAADPPKNQAAERVRPVTRSLTRNQSEVHPEASSQRRQQVNTPVKKNKPAAKPAVKSKAPAKAVAKVAKVVKVAAPAKKAVKAGPASTVKVKPAVKKIAPTKPVAKSKAVAKPVTPAAKKGLKPALKPVPKLAPKAASKVVPRPAKPAPAPAKKSVPAAKTPGAKQAGGKAVAASAIAPAPKPTTFTVQKPMLTIPSTTLKPGRRSSARTASQMPPSAPMVPTHAPDAAKASYGAITERLIAPPPHVAARKDPKLANNWKAKAAIDLTDNEVKAMPDSEYMNEKQLAFFRHKLSLLKQDIHNSAGETTEHLREDTVVVPDPADRATIEEEHALELRTRDRERKLLKKIEQSIARIDAGDYGYCDETGEAIGVGRLIARPTANLSLEAQQRRELKQKMFGD